MDDGEGGAGEIGTYLFMYASRSYFQNSARKVPMLGPVYGGTGVPFGLPVVVFGDGKESY
jgi:hypothetical protein